MSSSSCGGWDIPLDLEAIHVNCDPPSTSLSVTMMYINGPNVRLYLLPSVSIPSRVIMLNAVEYASSHTQNYLPNAAC